MIDTIKQSMLFIIIVSLMQLAFAINIPGVPNLNKDEYYVIGSSLLDINDPLDIATAHNVRHTISTSFKIDECKTKAEKETIRLFGKDSDNGEGNAFKHAFWSALMVKYTDYETAEKFATAHETGNDGNTNMQMDMDLHNNQVGRDIGRGFSGQSDETISLKVLNSLKSGKLWQINYPDKFSDSCTDCKLIPTGNRALEQSSTGKNPEITPAAADMVLIGTSQNPHTPLQEIDQTTDQSTNTKFSIGTSVETTDSLNVRTQPGTSSSRIISTMSTGSIGTILEGPVYADGFSWWKIQYEDGTEGWSQEKRLESVQVNQRSATGQESQSNGYEPRVISGYNPTYYPPGALIDGKEPVQLGSAANNQQIYNQQTEDQSSNDNELAAAGDETGRIARQPQTIASPYTSQIPSSDSQYDQNVQSAGPLPGQVQVDLDIRNEYGNTVPSGTQVTVLDGSRNYVSVNWDSNGHALAYGAPGTWTIIANAPGYATNTGYTTVSSASSSTSFRMNLIKEGANNQPTPISSPTNDHFTFQSSTSFGNNQQQGQSTANVPLELDIRDEYGNIAPPGTQVTVQDGYGNYVQVNWDNNGHALAYGSPGTWKITVNAPGYATNINNVVVSSAASSTSSRIYLQRGGFIDQPTSTSWDQQSNLQSEYNQPAAQMQYQGLTREQKDDILIDLLESRTQGRDLSEEEANDLMNDLDELQNQMDSGSESEPGGFQ